MMPRSILAPMPMRWLGLAMSLSCAPLPAQSSVVTVSRVRVAVQQARARLEAGDARAAAAQYDSAVTQLQELPVSSDRTRILSSALFGRAVAVQQQASTAVDSAAPAERLAQQQRIVADFTEAERLDSARFGGAASNNIGIVLREAGDHRGALAAFQRATASADAIRAQFFVHAAQEYAALSLPDSAAQAYRKALRIDSTLTSARAGLLELLSTRFPADSVVAVVTKWSVNPAHGRLVIDALYDLLRSGGRTAGLPDTALTLLAVNFATMGLGPADILRDHETRLLAAVQCVTTEREGGAGAKAPPPPLCVPIREMLGLAARSDARDARTYNRRFDGSRWWTSRVDRLAVWSMLLRSFAAAYDAAGNPGLALAYYEAALARPWTNGPPPPWMDIESIAPMAMLYAERSDGGASLREFLDGVFQGKSMAYEQNDTARLRRMHTALGALFVSRAEWSNGARGALFQLDRMRQMTRRLNDGRLADDKLADPPDLLNQLRVGLCRAGRSAEAGIVLRDVVVGFERSDRAASAPKAACEGAASAQPPARTSHR